MGTSGGRSGGAGASSDRARFRGLYEAHIRAVTAYCVRRLSPDRVDDAVAEVFLVAWRRIADVPTGDEERLWLFGVAYNVVSHEWRSSTRRQRLATRLGSLRIVDAESPEDSIVRGEQAQGVLDAVDRLSENDAEILRLVAWEHLSPAEIGAVLDLSPNAVHQRFHRAKRHLARQIDAAAAGAARAAPEGGVR